MAATSTVEAVWQLLEINNKPYSLQNLVDLLAHAGHKKAGIQKALDALIEQGKVAAKEFGKTKIFMPDQSKYPVLSKEELDAKKKQLAAATQQLQGEQEACRKLEQEVASLKSNVPISEMQAEIQGLDAKLPALRAKLAALQGEGAVLVSAEERAAAKKALSSAVDMWRKRKSMFRNIWDAVSEGLENVKSSDAFEEMGVDTDEAVGADMKAVEKLIAGPIAGRGGPMGFKRARPT